MHHFPKLRAALIGDVVASRQTDDRAALQISLHRTLKKVNSLVTPHQALTMTIGDEFQGAYLDLSTALTAGLRLQLILTGTAEVRIGVGWGELLFGDETTPLDQDGPCWWRARQALDGLKTIRGSRSRVVTDTELDDLLNAYLRLRDQLIGGFDPADATIALSLMDGKIQAEIAEALGLNRSSVSRRVSRHGIGAVLTAIPTRLPSPDVV